MRKVLAFILFVFLGIFVQSCQSPDGPAGLVLVSDKQSITADGQDIVTFTVTYNGQDITGGCPIVLKGYGNIGGNTWTTYSVGMLEFTAMYNGETSNVITVEAQAPEGLLLVGDKFEIEANGRDTCAFTVWQEGKDVTDKVVISDLEGILVTDRTFSSTAIGRYDFTAVSDGVKSNVFTVNVVAPTLVLASDKVAIMPDGTDAVTFTVTYQDEDVTSSAVIFVNERKLTGNGFTATETGQYEVYAQYKDMISNHIAIDVSSIRLVPSKESVPAKQGEVITLRVLQGNYDVSSESEVFYMRDMSEVSYDGETFRFVTTDNYVDEFKAVYNGEETFVRIGKEPESPFYKKALVVKTTGTWCTWCYEPGVILDGLLEGELKGRAEMACPHGNDIMQTDTGLEYVKFLNRMHYGQHSESVSYPLITIDYLDYISGLPDEEDGYMKLAETALARPAKCGIKVSSRIDGGMVVADVMLWSDSSEEFYVSAALLEDGIVEDQKSHEGIKTDYVHNNVLRYIDSPDDGRSWGKVARYDQKSGVFRFPIGDYDIEKCDIMVIVSVKENKIKTATNTVKLKVGTSIDFTFEK